MGGGQTVAIGFPNTKLFSHLVVMSAGGGQNPEQTYRRLLQERRPRQQAAQAALGRRRQGRLRAAGSKALDEALTKNNIKHTFRITEGRHEWVIWRHHLHEVAPLMFR